MSAFIVGTTALACCFAAYFGLSFLIWKLSGGEEDRFLPTIIFGPFIVALMLMSIGGLGVIAYGVGQEILVALGRLF